MTSEESPQVEEVACDLSSICPHCLVEMYWEHSHYRCAGCGYRDSCCF